jgi:hypothetical protein
MISQFCSPYHGHYTEYADKVVMSACALTSFDISNFFFFLCKQFHVFTFVQVSRADRNINTCLAGLKAGESKCDRCINPKLMP